MLPGGSPGSLEYSIIILELRDVGRVVLLPGGGPGILEYSIIILELCRAVGRVVLLPGGGPGSLENSIIILELRGVFSTYKYLGSLTLFLTDFEWEIEIWLKIKDVYEG